MKAVALSLGYYKIPAFSRGSKALLFIFRVLAISLPGVIALFLVMRAFIDGNTSDLRYAFAVMGMVGLSLCVPAPLPKQPIKFSRTAIKFAAVVLPILAIFPLTVVVLIFGEIDMAAFVFHLIFGMEGTPWDDIIPYVFTAAVLWLAFFISYARLISKVSGGVGVSMAVGAVILALNPLVNDLLLHRANAAFGPVRTLLGEFKEPTLIQSPEKPNLVILYLEGFDRGYMDQERFGTIAAPLQELEAEGISFTQLHQIEATGWSLAGTIATQCGAPLLPFGAKPLGDTSSIRRIMPDLTCLSDILTDRGYDITYMSGAKIIGNEMGYYGFDNFFSTHGNAGIEDRDTIATPRTAGFGADYQGEWGIFDSELLDGARELIDVKAEATKPFAVFIATMDTHGPAASISPECNANGEPRIGEDMREAIQCVSGMVSDFVQELIAEHGDDLRVAVFSDHLNHASNLTSLLEQKTRYNTAMLLGGADAARVIEKPGSMVDLYPTLLDWLGLLSPNDRRAGLGVSLLSEQPTLIESRGLEDVNATLRVDTALARHLWRNADATPTLTVAP
jgi:phosphoglycerol transferase